MQEFKRNVLWLKEIQHDDTKLVGDKAQEWAKIQKHVTPFAPSFVITSHAINSFFNQKNLKQNLLKLIEETDVNNPEALEECSASIRQAILTLNFPPMVREEIYKAYRKIGEKDLAWLSDSTEETVTLIPSHNQKGKNYSLNYQTAKNSTELLKGIQKSWCGYFSMQNIKHMKESNQVNFDFGIVVRKQGNFDVEGIRTTGEQGHKESLNMKKDIASFDKKMQELERASQLLKGIYQGDCTIEWGIEKNNLYILDVRKAQHFEQKTETKITESKIPLGIEDLSSGSKMENDIELPEIQNNDPIPVKEEKTEPEPVIEEAAQQENNQPDIQIINTGEVMDELPEKEETKPEDEEEEGEDESEEEPEIIEEKMIQPEVQETIIEEVAEPEEEVQELEEKEEIIQEPAIEEEKLSTIEEPEVPEETEPEEEQEYPEMEKAKSTIQRKKWEVKEENKPKKKADLQKEAQAMQSFMTLQEELNREEEMEQEKANQKVEVVADAAIPTKIESEEKIEEKQEESEDQREASGLDAFELLAKTNFWNEKGQEAKAEEHEEENEKIEEKELPLFFEMPETKFLPERVEKRWKLDK